MFQIKQNILVIENGLKKLKTFDLSYFRGKSHFENNGTQNYLVFFPIKWYFRTVTANYSNTNISSWTSKGLSDESMNPLTTSNKFLNPSLDYAGTKVRVKFNGDGLKQKKFTFTHGKIVKIYIVFEVEGSVSISYYPTLENCLFGVVKLTKHFDVVYYKYSGYGIGFYRKGFYSIGDEIGRNVIIFGVDMSSSSYIDNNNKKKLFLVRILRKD